MKLRSILLMFVLVSGMVWNNANARSLWTEDSPFNRLVVDSNASRVGDILTIIVQENNTANDTADGESEREHTANGIISMIFNNRFMNKVFGGPGNEPQLSFNSVNDFEGETEVDRSSQFNSQIAATIVRIDPAGNFLIEARKTLRIGEEHKTIVLSGKVRPRDIINNTVLSSQVADAEISYLGDGPITGGSNPTFLQRFFGFLF